MNQGPTLLQQIVGGRRSDRRDPSMAPRCAVVFAGFLALWSLSPDAHAKSMDPTCFLKAYLSADSRIATVTTDTVGDLMREAEAGDKTAQTTLALLYVDGKFVPKDADKAVEWATRAASQGGAPEKELLLFLTLGRDGDAAKSNEHDSILKRAEAGSMYFQYMYAELINQGGNHPQAARWYEKAAAQGCMDARTKLSRMHGWKTKEDRIRAYMWISLADYADVFDGRMRKELEYDENRVRKGQAQLRRKMSAAEIEEAERLAARWAKQHHESYRKRTWSDNAIVYLTDENLSPEIERSKGYLLMHFSSFDDNCDPCVQSNPTVDELARRHRGKMTFARIAWDPWWERHEVAKRYGVAAVPTTVLFKNGKEFRRWTGAKTDVLQRDFDGCCTAAWAAKYEKSIVRGASNDDAVVYLTDKNLSREIERSKGYMAVHFSTFDEDCKHCLQSNIAMDELARRYRGKVRFARVAWESYWTYRDRHREISQRYDVSGIPVTVLFKDGKEYRRWIGSSPDSISSNLDKMLQQ